MTTQSIKCSNCNKRTTTQRYLSDNQKKEFKCVSCNKEVSPNKCRICRRILTDLTKSKISNKFCIYCNHGQ